MAADRIERARWLVEKDDGGIVEQRDPETETLLLALYGRALLLRQEGATTQNALAACDVLERAAHEREAELWVATACATRARFRVDSGDIGGATAYLPAGRTGARCCHRFREHSERPVETGQRARLSLPSVPQRKGQEKGNGRG